MSSGVHRAIRLAASTSDDECYGLKRVLRAAQELSDPSPTCCRTNPE